MSQLPHDPQEGSPEEQWSYERLIDEIRQAPDTWMPAILSRTLQYCVQKQVFRDREAFREFCNDRVDEYGR